MLSPMKKIIITIFLSILFNNISYAADPFDFCGKQTLCIKDLKIGNLSLGDSLLKTLDKKEIKKYKAKNRKYKTNKYKMIIIPGQGEYNEIWVSYLAKDKNYEIAYLKGVKHFEEKDECRSARTKLIADLKKSMGLRVSQKKNNPDLFMMGKSIFWGTIGCTQDGVNGLSLIVAPQRRAWSNWYSKAYIPGKS